MPDVTTNGITIHYETRGNGPKKIVFLHGLMLTSHIWDEVMDLLPSEYQCFALDARGFGASSKEADDYSLPTLAKDISCFIKDLGISKTTIVGHSVSGPVAIFFGANHPDQVDNVVLVGTFARECTITGRGGSGDGMKELLRMFENPPAKISRELMNDFLRYLVYDMDYMGPRMADSSLGYSTNAERGILMQTMLSTVSHDIETELTRIEHPLLVVHGPADTLFLKDEAEFMANAVPNGQLTVIDQCGHLPMLERPHQFVTALTEFLS
ncbi:MAG: alpha/beta hydrolase [Chloroflexota bacterium]|nr:alpha/beta hydrolase [Chloroflexota bacterium]